MFEVAEVGHRLKKQEFTTREPLLRTDLLAAQRALHDARIPVIIIVAGVEGAGKGEVVNRFSEWLDPRGIRTHAFWDETDEERERPTEWRFWRALPPRGSIGILFGSWYTRPILRHAFGELDDAALEQEMDAVAALERMLTNDGALIVKLWFHLSPKAQADRITADKHQRWSVSPFTKKFAKRYQRLQRASELALRLTDTGESPWYIIEATDPRYRDITAGEILLGAMQRRLTASAPTGNELAVTAQAIGGAIAQPTILDTVDPSITLQGQYGRLLDKYQRRLHQLTSAAFEKKRSSVVVFEGWDAAGKGGTIRRLVAALDARLYRVISIAAPTDEEKAHHYLWRFWRHVPRAGYVTFYDRSWYGRVLVERVEHFARETEWMRAYQEITRFEKRLHDHGIVLTKFWLHISAEEQLKRFHEREKTPWKQHKITEEDWRNREKSDQYKCAVNDMVARTSTAYAPWYLIGANDKQYARLAVLRTLCERLEAALDNGS